jgi:hypothetical protein
LDSDSYFEGLQDFSDSAFFLKDFEVFYLLTSIYFRRVILNPIFHLKDFKIFSWLCLPSKRLWSLFLTVPAVWRSLCTFLLLLSDEGYRLILPTIWRTLWSFLWLCLLFEELRSLLHSKAQSQKKIVPSFGGWLPLYLLDDYNFYKDGIITNPYSLPFWRRTPVRKNGVILKQKLKKKRKRNIARYLYIITLETVYSATSGLYLSPYPLAYMIRVKAVTRKGSFHLNCSLSVLSGFAICVFGCPGVRVQTRVMRWLSKCVRLVTCVMELENSRAGAR